MEPAPAAADGAAALRAAADRPAPDVVILDLGLPDMPGLEVLEGLRQVISVCRRLPSPADVRV